ncbi:MAG: hypothetical protein KDN05_03090 [Verrucomicrobiae bacterium]|nr:hypothetical protein [Verrucomicrobiae bacterium]MCP5548929.1 hypothetical protein [Akkermansiaceae bacterium]
MWLPTLFLICLVGTVLEQALSWTAPLQGARNGALMGLFIAIPFVLVYALLGGIVGALSSFGPLRPHRWWLSLVPALLMVTTSLAQRISDRIRPERRFQRWTTVSLPDSVRDLRHKWTGGYFFDYMDTYRFRCSPSDTERLVDFLSLAKQRDNKEGQLTRLTMLQLDDEADHVDEWENLELWRPARPLGKADFLLFYTDASHTRVLIVYGTI